MPNPLDTLYDQLKGQYPDLVDRSEFIGKLSNEDELKKLHDAASKDIPGFVDFDNFKSKVGESLSTYDQDSDYKAQSASAEQESAPTDITIPRREKGRHVPSKTQKSSIESEAYVPVQPGQPTDTRVDAEAFDRETGDLDELGRRYEEKAKRLEGYGREPNLYVNEEDARKHYEAYSRLLDEAEQDRLVYNRRVKAAEDERAEQQRQLDLQSKDRKTRRTAEYGGYTNDQVRKEQERLKKERAYLEDPKSKRKADYSKRVMEYNADQTALSGEADKRNKRAESKRAMYDEVKKVAEDPDVQKRITGNDTTAYVLSGSNPYALQNYDAARERAKTMSDEELVEHCKAIAGQKYARGDNKDIYAPLAASFMAYHNELMYRLGGDEPKSALEMRYDMIDKVTESSPEGDEFMTTLRNYLDGTSGMGTANYENDRSERANIPQFAIVDYFNSLLAQKEAENRENVERIAHEPNADDFKGMEMARAALDINYDSILQQAFERFGNENLKAYITAYALRNGISVDEAARRVNQSIWDETIGKEMEESRPKSNAEFFLRRITSDNMFAKLWQIGLRAQNGTLGSTDPFTMNSMMLDEYAKDHPILETGAVVFNFAVMEGPIFSAYGKLAGGLVGAGERAIIGAATKTAEKTAIESTVKALNQSFWYRLAKGVPTGGLVGFQYGTMSGAIDQAYYDGNVNFGKVIANGLHMGRDFAIMHGVGEVFGLTGDAILRRGMRKAENGQGVLRNRLETASLDFLNNVAKTTTNAAVVTGLYAAIDKPALERENKKIAAENARLPEDQQKPLNQIASVEDTFYSSLRMFAGLDAVGALRRAWSIGVRGDYERNKHVKVHFDKFDKDALEKAFGKNPNSLLRQIVFGNVDGIPAKWFEIDPEAEQEIYKELGRELTPAEKEAYATYGFTELRKVILNKDIPWATRAKIVSVITGRVVQEPPVAKGDIKFEMDSSGTQIKRIIVKSLDLEGNVIQVTEFSGREFEAARRLVESLNDRGWRNNAMLCGNLVIDAIEDKTYADTVDEMAREKGIAPEQFEQMVFGIKQKDITGEKVTYQERQLVDEFDKRHQEKQKAETELSGPSKLFEQIAREVFGADWKQAKAIPLKSWGEMTEAEKEFVNRYIDRMGAMGVAERNKLMNANPDWARTAKEYEESVRRRMAEAERPAEAEPLPALEDEKVSVEIPAEERVEPTPEVIELEEEKPAEPEPVKEETPTEEPVAEKPDTEGQPQAGTIGFEPVEQPTERERFDAERKAKAATITDADIEANREALGIPEGTALTDEARQIYAEDLAEDLMRYERFKRGESDEKARFHDYWESKFNPKRPKLEKPVEKQEEPVEDETTDTDALIEQLDNLKGRSDLEKYRNALTVFAGDAEIMAILEDLEPHNITEWVSSFLGLDSGKGYSMLWESKTRNGSVIAKGFKEETGWGWNDTKGFAFMFDNKNGLSPRRVAEKIWEELPSGMKDKYSDVDVFNIMMDLFKSSSRKSDQTNYIRNNRMEQVRDLLNRRRNEELAEIARYKERERRGEEEPTPEPVASDESANEFVAHEDDVAPFSLLSLNYRQGEVEGGTIRSRARVRKQIGTIAKALGYKIRWVADKPYNAKIDTDEKVLYLNIRTDQPLAAVMGHEVTHDLRKSDPEAYETLKRYAKDLLGQEQWDNEVKDVTDVYNEEYKRRGWEPIRADKAEEEVVCDTMGKLLHSRKGLRELAGSLDPGVAGKVYRLMKKITGTIKHALDEIGDVTDPDYRKPDYSTMDAALQEFLEAVKQRAKKGDIATIQNTPAEGEATIDLSLRRKPAPKKVRKVYKLMRLKMSEDGKTLGEDGKVYPLYIDSGTGLDLKNWYDADSPAFDKLRGLDKGYWLYDLTTGEAEKADKPSKEQIAQADAQGKRYMVIRDVYDDVYDKYNKDKENWEASQRGEKKWKKKKPFTPLTPEQLEKKAVKAQKDAEKRYSDTRRYYNIGLNGSGDVGEYALRPGWHAGSHPTMRQIGKGKNKNLRDDTFVWVEGYVPDDVEYQTEAEGNIDKDIPTHIPTDGHYLMLTNPNAKAAQADRVGWYVAGAFRPERILSDWEARQVIDEWNAAHPNDKIEYDFERESGRVFNAETMQLEEPGSEEAKQGIHRDPSGGYSVTDKADIESMAPRMDGESEAAYNERIAEIGADENAFVDGDGQFSLKREDTMRDNSVKYFEEYHVRGNKDRKYGPLRRNSITRQALDKANEMIAEMRDYIAPWYDREAGGNRYLPEEVYGLSTIFDNASYGATLENTLICTRTLAYNDFCDSVKRKLGRPLTKRESFLASQMLYDIATDPQCLYCYVSLDRKAYDEYLLRYFDERDAVIERYNKMRDKSAENIDALYKTFLDGRKDTYQMRSRFNSWLQLADHDSAIGRDKVALSSDRKNALAQESDEEAAVRWRDINKQYNRLRGDEKKQFKQSKQYLDALHAYLATEQGQIKDACAYAQGASWAKKEAEYRSYTGELLRTTKRMLGGLASHYGLRFYSFSEYSPAFILENMQMVRDAALRGLKGFAYTKEIDFCKIFLPTGININCSTYGRRNAAGEIVMDERQGANWDEARALRDQYENMGIVFVATDDEMVRWAKEQPWIDVIIPFHIVRTGADIAEFYGWTNYTNVSADYDAQGRHKDIMPPEHNNSIEDYDRLIAERGLTRRFPQFYDGPGDQNYMKLINETRRKASDTPILTPVFNMEEAKKSFDRFVEKGGYWGGFYEVGADDVVRAVDEVVSDIEAGKSAGEVEYGRQDIDFDSAMANLEKTRRRINRNREHGNTPKTSFSLKREKQTHSENFKRWFGDWENDPEHASKVVDAEGRPLVVYHQTNAKRWINRETGEDWEKLDWRKKMEWENRSQEEWEDAWEEQDFYTFDDRYARQSIEMPAIFFSPENDPHHEYGERTIAAYLDIKNPAINPDIPNRGVTDTAGRDAMEALKAQGYDGFIRTDEDGNIREYGVFDSNQVKSADENNGDFDPNNPDIRFSLMGRRGAARLDNADHGDRMDRNAIAEEMEKAGKDARTIKLATGWERRADGKWRHEEPDGDFVDKGINVEYAEQHRLKLSDIWDSPELFKAYPEFAEIPVEIVNNPLGASATTQVDRSYEMPEFEVYEKFIRDYDQWLENTKKRRDQYKERLSSTNISEEQQEQLSSIIDNLSRDIADAPNRLARLKEIVADPDKIMFMKLYLNKAHLSKDGVISADAEFSGNNARQVVAHEIQHLIQENEGFASGGTTRDMTYGEYRRLAGETEARNVSRRVDMPEYERRRSLASDTEDVPRERQTVRYTSKTSESNSSEVYTDLDGNKVYRETREDGTKDREITTYGDGSQKALWYDDKGNLKERLDYFPNGEVSQVTNYDSDGNLTRNIQYDENRRITSYYLPEIGTDWHIDDNGVISGKSNGVEIKPYNFQFSLKREQTHSENFKRWFGDWENDPEHASKVVDKNGRPLVMYHGTQSKFNIFDKSKKEKNYGSRLSDGFYFTEKKDIADFYTKHPDDNVVGEIKSVYLNIRNPLYVKSPSDLREQIRRFESGLSVVERDRFNALSDSERLQKMGYDGVIEENEKGLGEYVVFDPTQIKSATENNGDFSRENPDIRYSLKRNTAELDKEYVDAIKRGDERRAIDMLLNKALSAVGITPYIAPHGYGGSHRDIAKRLKTNEGNAVVRAVADMQRFIPDNAVLVPMPPHEGEVTEETDTMILADALSVITGKPVVVALEGEPRESRYAAKAAGRPGISAEEMGFRKIADIPEGKVPIIIDNVVGTGETAKAAVNALGGGITLAYAKATRSKATQGLKNATITYDDNGNIIPLSERFDAANSDVNYSLKRRRNRDDYTDEDRADAAIIANTYLAQADALRQQIEADRQREHQLVEERNKLLAFDYPAADPADRPAIMDRINELRNQINDLRNANYENNTKLRSMDYEYRVAKEILEQGAVTDEEAARFDAGQMTREEKVLESLFKAAADSRADKKAKQKAIRGLVRELVAITDNFKAAMKARGIESQRKHYDKGTVDHIIRLARAMMGTGYIDNMTSYEAKRLMGMINNAATRESIEEQAGRIVDMMLDHQIRTLRKDFDKQLKVTGQKTNSSGVQVQAGLDQEGQVVMEAMRKSMQIIADSAGERYDSNGYLTEWGEFYEKTLNDMGDADPVKAEQARKIFEGVWLASKWYEDVRTMEINGRILRSQMEDFKASNKPAKDADADTKQRYADVLADYQEMLRQNKIKIIEAYERMTGDVGMTQAESVRRAKEFADAQKQRVNEIQHNANSDLADVDDNTQVETPESRVFGANKNNVLARLLFASAGTYEKFMRFFGRMAPNGEGYLFKRFMTQYHHARQDYWKGRHSAFEEMDKKMAEVFGKKKMHWSDIYEMTRDHKKFPPITVSYWDGYRNGQPYVRVDQLNQSEALYLYMINKMPDGRMKLRHMGITDDVIQQMAGQINNKLIKLADWLQGEFLPKMRIKYNETHKRVFGADMAAIEDYFPLRINKLAVASDMDITERDMNDNKPSTITGAIVKRRVNTLPIDLHTDAFDVALSHIDEMEHWSAFAEFNRDNNTLVNYKRFRTKVNNMRSLELGAGNVLWKNFTDAVAIAADAYHPRAGSRSGDHYSTRVAKFVSTAKIALRPYTALKQLLSIPAFWADSDPLEQMKATLNVADTWQWAIENLPGFAERWQSRQAGNIKLANYNDLSGLRRRKTMRKLQRAGMWANAAIDGLACAMGGKAVYETKYKRYLRMGYDDARAQEKALIDAAIAYNNSQQSSEGAYVSPLQVDRTWFANAFSVFRSASMGYTRRLNTSLRQLRNATFKPGYGAQSVEFLKKQMMRDGLTEEQATKWAHRIYRRANLKAAASVAIFGQILPFAWNLGANMFYLLFGDDDKEKEGILADSFRHSFFGPVEGLTGGNVISELGDIAADTAIGNIWGDSIWGDSEAYKALGYRDFSTMPLSSDLRNLLKYFARDEVKAANEVVNILFQVATGVNPQTITDWATAILDFSRSDMERRDIAMFAMRLLSTPQQQLDKFYLDQMNLSQEQASKMSVDDLIKRYATYKRWRETPLTGWMYSDEREKEVEEKFQKRYEEMLEERSVAEEGLRGTINSMQDLPRKRTMMQKLQKELTDSIEAADPELYKKALEGEKADDDEYVRHVTDKDVEQMAELAMKKKALRAARDRKVKADKDAEAGRITQEEYDAIYKECAHQWKLYNYLNNTLPKKLKEWKLKMEPDMQDKYTPEQVMDTIRSKTDKALQMRPEDMKLKKGDKKKVKKNKKK